MGRKIDLYVAGSWDDRHDVKYVMQTLESAGFNILVDWTRHSAPEAEAYAREDRAGVFQCDALVFLSPKNISRGKYIELGMATALRKPIICISKAQIGIFEHLGHIIHAADIESAISILSGPLPNLYADAPRYIYTCKRCHHEFSPNYQGQTGILDCPKCCGADFAIWYESGKNYIYREEEDTPGVKKTVREEVK